MATDPAADDAIELLASLDDSQQLMAELRRTHPFDGPVYRAATRVLDSIATARSATIAQQEALTRLNARNDDLLQILRDTPTSPPVLQ